MFRRYAVSDRARERRADDGDVPCAGAPRARRDARRAARQRRTRRAIRSRSTACRRLTRCACTPIAAGAGPGTRPARAFLLAAAQLTGDEPRRHRLHARSGPRVVAAAAAETRSDAARLRIARRRRRRRRRDAGAARQARAGAVGRKLRAARAARAARLDASVRLRHDDAGARRRTGGAVRFAARTCSSCPTARVAAGRDACPHPERRRSWPATPGICIRGRAWTCSCARWRPAPGIRGLIVGGHPGEADLARVQTLVTSLGSRIA